MEHVHTFDADRLGALFGDLQEYHGSIRAVLSGNNPGSVYVDDPANPQLVLLFGPEGTYVGGQSPDDARVADLKSLINHLMTDLGLYTLWIDAVPEWKSRLADVLAWPLHTLPRQHYLFADPARLLNWRAELPTGFSVQPITRELLDRESLDIPEHIRDWIAINWGSVDVFAARGFGTVILDEAYNRVVSWSLCDCVAGEACEIGIHTQPEYRRRGFAAITAAATVDRALSLGFRTVGWHCDQGNIGSWRTALKVGFTLDREFTMDGCTRIEAKSTSTS